jgi:DNA adenine methylase
MQTAFLLESPRLTNEPLKGQLLKWIGNKQKFAEEIVRSFPSEFGTYHEPFLGSGGVLATMAPISGVGSDTFGPLMEIWQTLSSDPETVKEWYESRWLYASTRDKKSAYEDIKADYNRSPNGADLLFLCRSCYGGVVRFRMADGYMSTPCGIHAPISPQSFAHRVDNWHSRLTGTKFYHRDYQETLAAAKPGDIVYCDPPYTHSQTILYGAQRFSLVRLMECIQECKDRGVYVALSIDGTKKSGDVSCALPIPFGLFERELYVQVGRSMLRRFQMGGETLEAEHVSDRLLLTF